MPKPFIGIDPGLRGGIAGICAEWGAWCCPMPVIGGEIDGQALRKALLDRYGLASSIGLVCVEKVNAMPKQGVTSTFKFGCGYGMVRGVLAAMGLSVVLVTPQRWKKTVLAGLPHDKDGAVRYCSDRWPEVNLIPPRCRVAHDGMADALCLAEFGRMAHA